MKIRYEHIVHNIAAGKIEYDIKLVRYWIFGKWHIVMDGYAPMMFNFKSSDK